MNLAAADFRARKGRECESLSAVCLQTVLQACCFLQTQMEGSCSWVDPMGFFFILLFSFLTLYSVVNGVCSLSYCRRILNIGRKDIVTRQGLRHSDKGAKNRVFHDSVLRRYYPQSSTLFFMDEFVDKNQKAERYDCKRRRERGREKMFYNFFYFLESVPLKVLPR